MSLEEIFEEAKTDKRSVDLSVKNVEEAYVYKGIKISKTDSGIKIISTFKLNLRYSELNSKEYEIFHELGWKDAIHFLLKIKYKNTIAKITENIKKEINSRNNKKRYDSLKTKRETLLNKYSNLNK